MGTFEETVDFNVGGDGGTVTSNGTRDIYLMKLNANGDFIWIKTLGGTGSEYAYSLRIDDNYIYLSGVFYATVDFGLGTTPRLETSQGDADTFVLKLDHEGDFVWVNTYGGTGQDYAAEVLLNNAGDVYLAGGFANTVDFEYGDGETSMTSAGGFFGLDSYLLKLNSLGEFEWVKSTVTSTGDVFVRNTKMDALGNIYNVGSIEATSDFDPSENVNEASTGTSTNTSFIQKLNSDGELEWVIINGNLVVDGIAFTTSNNLLLVGEFSGTQDFDMGDDTYNLTPVNSTYAAFFQTINSNGDFVNAYFIDGYNNEAGRYITKDVHYTSDGDLLVYGKFSGTIDLNVSSTVSEPHTSAGSNDVFLLRQTNFDVGIESFSVAVSIFPNPTTGQVTINTDGNNSVVNVYNISGQKVYSEKIVKNTTFNLDEDPGVYIIELLSGKEVRKVRVVKL